MRSRVRRFAVGALAYLLLSVAWLYGLLDEDRLQGGGDVGTWSIIGLVVAVHVAFGWAIREWGALVLPIVVVFLAIPAGYPESQFSEPLPLWIGQIVVLVFEIPAIAVGLALRTFYDGWRRTPWPSR